MVITENFDVPGLLPINQYTDRDGARVMGCGIQLMMGEYFRGGSHVSFNRQCWRKDWCTMAMGQFTHLGGTVYKTHKGQNIPITININPPPSVLLVAGEGGVRTIVVPGDDELGIAGNPSGPRLWDIVKGEDRRCLRLCKYRIRHRGLHYSGARVGDLRSRSAGRCGRDPLLPGMAQISWEDLEGSEVPGYGNHPP